MHISPHMCSNAVSRLRNLCGLQRSRAEELGVAGASQWGDVISPYLRRVSVRARPGSPLQELLHQELSRRCLQPCLLCLWSHTKPRNGLQLFLVATDAHHP